MTDNDTTSVSESGKNVKPPINNNNNNNNHEVATHAREVRDQQSRIDTSSQGKAGNPAAEVVAAQEPSMMDSIESENSRQQGVDSIVNNGDMGAVDVPDANSEIPPEVQGERFGETQVNDRQSNPPEGINYEHRS